MADDIPTSFGYSPDPPKKAGEKPDREFSSELLPLLNLSASEASDFREHCTDTNQRSLPACVGNATADGMEVLSSLQGNPKVELSRMFIWTLARNMMDMDNDGEGDININSGTYVRLAFDVLVKFGICLEEYWPYDMTKWNRLPSFKAMRKATGRKLKGYYRITETGNARVERLIQALRAEHPIVFGTSIDAPFQSNKGEIISIPKGEIIGGHAMLVVGYDLAKGFIVKNSWGPGWGDGGFGYFSPEYMGWRDTRDVWVPTIGRNYK